MSPACSLILNKAKLLQKSTELPPRVVNVSSSAGKVANMKDSPIKEKLISSGSTLTVRRISESSLMPVRSCASQAYIMTK